MVTHLPLLQKAELLRLFEGFLNEFNDLLATAGDLITAALRQYEKEPHLPLLHAGASGFDLHYSQYSSLESLDREEKLVSLGSRNFFRRRMRRRPPQRVAVAKSRARCSNEADSNKGGGGGLPWLRFMEFSL
ncbi:hypothetical protein OROHE_012383 [Orobanche hederae]